MHVARGALVRPRRGGHQSLASAPALRVEASASTPPPVMVVGRRQQRELMLVQLGDHELARKVDAAARVRGESVAVMAIAGPAAADVRKGSGVQGLGA